MYYIEQVRDIMIVSDKNYIVQTMAMDYKITNTIAKKLDDKFKYHHIIKKLNRNKFPDLIPIHKVFTLIVRKTSNDKVSMTDLEKALEIMKKLCVRKNIKKLAFCKESFDCDGMEWKMVKKRIFTIFKQTNVRIMVCTNKITNTELLTDVQIDLIL